MSPHNCEHSSEQLSSAIQKYRQGLVSQEKAAEIAGLSRAGFVDALSKAEISPFQTTPEVLREELRDAN